MLMKPVIGITMGDPASIGPELCIRALSNENLYERCCPLIVGDVSILQRAMQIHDMPKLKLHPIEKVKDAFFTTGVMDVINLQCVSAEEVQVGQINAKAGDAAFRYVHKVIELAMANEVDATVTNALNKEALNLAGHHFSGHTEIYAHYTDTQRYTMMLAHEGIRIVHVSTHVSLREACDRVKKARVLEVIRIAAKACQDMGIASPRIGVAGLNPHCGEGGLFGREEIEEIRPAIEAACAEGIDAQGPVPPDTVFSKACGGWYDIVVAMYHDQGHIPLKLMGFVFDRQTQKWKTISGVNITLGLPIIRTSVDHGTAFDQAGLGTASEISLLNAIQYAIDFARTRMRK